MTRTLKLSGLSTFLDSIDYPASRSEVATEVDDVTLQLADGETPLETVVDDLVSEAFDSRGDLEAELYQFLPIGAVGEPGQSEGDA